MLREIELRAIRAAESKAWTSSHERFRDRGALVDWLLRYTGGHPWLLSTLMQELCTLAVDEWPAWTRERAVDDERERGLHDPDGPLRATVQELCDGLRTIAPTLETARNPLLGLRGPSGDVIGLVAACFGGPQ
jgi:hypothetical protein